MSEITTEVVFLPELNKDTDQHEVARILRLLEKKYNLTHVGLAVEMGYARDSKVINHALWKPEKYIGGLFIKKLTRTMSALAREYGHTHSVTLADGITTLAQTFRVTHKFKKCKGHKVPCTFVDAEGFCGKECKELHGRKKK